MTTSVLSQQLDKKYGTADRSNDERNSALSGGLAEKGTLPRQTEPVISTPSAPLATEACSVPTGLDTAGTKSHS